jgi:hypothetical protein
VVWPIPKPSQAVVAPSIDKGRLKAQPPTKGLSRYSPSKIVEGEWIAKAAFGSGDL